MLRIVPVDSRVQRLVTKTNSRSSPLSPQVFAATGITGPLARKENARPAGWRDVACRTVIRREFRRDDAGKAGAISASSTTEPDTIGGAQIRENPGAGRNTWRGIEPRFDAMPELFELEPTLIGPKRSGDKNEPI
jgi:hypothetical protein